MANRYQFIQSHRGAFRQSEKGARGIARPWIWSLNRNGITLVNPDGTFHNELVRRSYNNLAGLAVRPDRVAITTLIDGARWGCYLLPHFRHGYSGSTWSYVVTEDYSAGAPEALAFDSNNDVIQAGWFSYASGDANQYDVIKLDGTDGTLIWKKALHDPPGLLVKTMDVAVDDSDNIYLVGGPDDDDNCLWKLNSAGETQWSFAPEMVNPAAPFPLDSIRGVRVVMCSDGSVVFFMSHNAGAGNDSVNSLVYKVSSSGDEEWRAATSVGQGYYNTHSSLGLPSSPHDATIDSMGNIYYTSEEHTVTSETATAPFDSTDETDHSADSHTGRLTCMSEATGEVVWAVDQVGDDSIAFSGVAYDSRRKKLWVVNYGGAISDKYSLQSRDIDDGSLIDSNIMGLGFFWTYNRHGRLVVEGAG